MKIITKYQCEICGSCYTNQKDAEYCETRQLPPLVPIGCIDGDNTKGAFYEDIIFVMAKHWPVEGHTQEYSTWAWRDNKNGDNDIDSNVFCSAGHHFHIGTPAVIDRTAPRFARMIANLKKHNITPTIWDGEKAVPLIV
jgi:hypothetical protein